MKRFIILLAILCGLAPLIASKPAPPAPRGATALKMPAAVYKAKCAMCHTGNAGKFFDPTGKTDDVLADTVLKGRKGEKPPFMPAFSEKGISADQAKALVTYMKSLKQ